MRELLLTWLLCWPLLAQGAPAARLLHTLEADLEMPSAVAVAENGEVFVLDGLKRRIVVFDTEGKAVRELSLPAPAEKPAQPATDLVLPQDRLFVADPSHGRILVLDPEGKLLRELRPAPGDLPSEPSAVEVAGGRAWWSDRRNHRLCTTPLEGNGDTHCTGSRGDSPEQFNYPYMLAQDSHGYLLVVDVLNGRVRLVSPGGEAFGSLGRFGTGPGELYRPNGIALIEDGTVAVSDAWLGRVNLYHQRRPAGNLQDASGSPLEFDLPVGLASSGNRLLVVEMGANRVRVLELLPGEEPAAKHLTSLPPESRRSCLICHYSWLEEGTSEERPGPVLPVADQRMCLSCHHGAVVESRPRIGRGHQHPTLHRQRDGSPAGDTKRFEEDEVPEQYPLTADGHLYCGSCHTPHARPEGVEPLHQGFHNPWLRHSNRDSAACTDCHASKINLERPRSGQPEILNHPVGIRMRPPPHPGKKGYPDREELQEGLPEPLAVLGARLGEGYRLICQSCHQVHGGTGEPLLVDTGETNRLCVTCHRSQHASGITEARKKGIHPVEVKLDKPVQLAGREIRDLDCLSCHRVHEGEPGTPLLPKGTNRNTLCSSCHQRQDARNEMAARTKGVHPVNLELEKPVKITGRAVRRLECDSCHALHGGVSNTPALVEDHLDGSLCRNCHKENLEVGETDHDLRKRFRKEKNRLKQPYADAGLCGGCHSLHRAGKGKRFLDAAPELPEAERYPLRDRPCLACHRKDNSLKAASVEAFDHPWRDLILRSDPEVMPLLDGRGNVSEFGRIGCITCHEPHHWHLGRESSPSPVVKDGNEEGTVISSFLRRKGVKGTFCVDCHGLQAHYKYKYFHDEPAREKQLPYLK